MSALTIPNSFTAYSKIKSADVNANFTAIATVINGLLSDSNIAANGITRGTKLSLGTAYRIVANASDGSMSQNAALTAAHVLYADANGQLAGEAALSPIRGGTGVANNAASTLTRSGNHDLAITTTGTTTVTMPTTGTLATRAGVETFTNKYFNGGTASTSNRISIPADTTTNLNTLAASLAAGDLVYDTTVNSMKYKDASTLQTLQTGTLSVAAVGASPNANAASVSSFQLTLQPANGSFPGVVTTTAQTFAGAKTFTGGIVGSDGTGDATAGNIGEYKEVKTSTNTSMTTSTGQYQDLVGDSGSSISLTAGDWDLDLVVVMQSQGGTVSEYIVGIGTATGNSATGLATGDTAVTLDSPTASAFANSTNAVMNVNAVRVRVSSTTTYYPKGAWFTGTTSPKYRFRFSARRVR